MKTNDYIIERPSKEIIPFRTNATSHRGIILSLLTKFRKDAEQGFTYTPLELKQVFEECLTKYNELKKNSDIVTLELQGWKGKDLIEVDEFDSDFVLLEHRKEKDSNEVETITHKIPKENVNRLYKFIKSWKLKESRECYDFTEILGQKEWAEVWKKRTDVYFPLYYYPIKCLEHLKIIKYSGRGKITRLK